MIKQFILILVALFVLLSLNSCASRSHTERSSSPDIYQDEGGIVGTGKTVNCEQQTDEDKINCTNGAY